MAITWKSRHFNGTKLPWIMEGVTKRSHLSPKEAAIPIELPSSYPTNRSRICVGISEPQRWANDGSPIQTVSETTSWLFMSTSNDMVDLLQLHVDLLQLHASSPWHIGNMNSERNHQYQRTVVHGHKTRMWAAQGCQRHLEWSQRKAKFHCAPEPEILGGDQATILWWYNGIFIEYINGNFRIWPM